MDLQSDGLKFDGDLTIAIGKSRKETSWKNREMAWSELVARLGNVKRTPETYAEYLAMSDTEQAEVKDVGGFVGGVLHGGRRKIDSVKWRQLITLDADSAAPGMWDDFTMIYPWACVAYSTHKHQPEKPRLRFVLPLSRPVSPEEYECISRTIAADIGIEYWDPVSYRPHQLMYWPSASKDAEFLWEWQDGKWIDPDEVLARYEDWRDVSQWPGTAPDRKAGARQQDPLDKPGVVGAFCRTYTISAAIQKYLSDVYEPAGEDRYTYLHGTTTGGFVVYDDDTLAYSFHGTDPVNAGGHEVNAFDLVRIHLFGDQDEGADSWGNRAPSYRAMLQLAEEDEDVKQQYEEERLEKAGLVLQETEDRSWLRSLKRNQNGQIINNAQNIKLILQKDPNIANKVAVDLFAHRIVVRGDLPWKVLPDETSWRLWTDSDEAALRNYLSEIYGITKREVTMDSFIEVVEGLAYHPVRDYLQGLEWDEIPRLDTLLIDYLGAEDSAYTRAVTRKTLVAAVARVMRPGTKVDTVLTLYGPQGSNKSEIVKRLGVDWGSDSLTTVTGKEAYEQIQGCWVIEMGELAAMRKADIEAVKHFISKPKDRFRPAYGHNVVEYPRECIFIATTNEDHFLRDLTGNRRFWVVEVNPKAAKGDLWVSLTRSEMDQVWAEAVFLWKAGEPLRLPAELESDALAKQERHLEDDGKLGLILEFLEKPIPGNWYSLPTSSRRLVLSGGLGAEEDMQPRDRVCALEIWTDCFGNDPSSMTTANGREINGLLRKLPGWIPNGNKLRFGPVYGVQRAFVKEGLIE